MRHQRPDLRRQAHQKIDYTTLPDDHIDVADVFLTVDVTNPAPPGGDADEASWVVRYGAT